MTLDTLMQRVRTAAAGRIGVLSTGEALAAALVLNRPDWLADRGYTIGEALARLDPGDAGLIPAAERLWRQEKTAADEITAIAEQAGQVVALFGEKQDPADPLYLNATLVSYGEAPGYRDATLILDLAPSGAARACGNHRVTLHLSAQDSADIALHLIRVHHWAWARPGKRPLDAAPDETRPQWVALWDQWL